MKATRNKRTRILDNGGKTFDRYTLITHDGMIYGFNDNPYHPQGFGQYCGQWTGGSTKHLGKLMQIADLPEEAQKFVKERM
jgi:hypothetical protein